MRKLAAEMQKTGASADSELGQKLQAAATRMTEAKSRVGELNEKLRATSGHAGVAGEAVGHLRESLVHLAEVAGLTLGLEGIKSWIESSAELGEQIERTSVEMGVSASQASELSGVATLTGTSFDALAHNIERFQLNLAKSGKESSAVAQGLHALGMSARQFINVPIPEQLERLAEGVSKFADGGAKTAAILAILGRNGVEMLPFLDRGKEGFEELQKVMARTGFVMGDEVWAGFQHTKEGISEMSLAWQGLSNRLFEVARGPIDAVIKKITQMMESMSPEKIQADMIIAVQSIGSAVSAIGGFAISVEDFFKNIGADIQIVKDDVAGLIAPFERATEAVRKLDEAHNKAVHSAIVDAGHQMGVLGGSPLGLTTNEQAQTPVPAAGGAALGSGPHPMTAGEMQTALDLQVNHWIAGIRSMITGSGKEQFGPFKPPGTKPQAGTMNIGGAAGHGADKGASDAMQEQLKGFDDQIAAAHKAFENEAKLDALKVSGHKMTEMQKLQDTKQALDQEYSLERAALVSESKLEDLKPAKRKEILDKLHALDEQYHAQAEQLAQQTANEQSKIYSKAFGGINSAFTSQIDGLLKGTETIGTAFKKMAADIIENLIKVAAEALLTKVELSLISAIPGAGALLGGIESLLIPSFDVGAWSIPHDTLAMVHANEMVVPARGGVADSVRGLLSGGSVAASSAVGGTTVIHNHNYNGALMDRASVTKAVIAYQKSNPSKQGDW